MLWHIWSMRKFKKKGLQKQTSFCPGFFGDGTWHESNGDRPDTVLRFLPRGGHRQRLLLIKATFSWSWPLPIMMTMWTCLRPGWSMMFSTDCAYTEFRAYRSNQTLFFRFSNEVLVFLKMFLWIFPAWLSRNIDYGEIFVKGMLEYDAKFTEHRYWWYWGDLYIRTMAMASKVAH